MKQFNAIYPKRNPRRLFWHKGILPSGILLFLTLFTVSLQAQTLEWGRHLVSPKMAQANATALDQAGNLYVVGFYKDTVDFDPGPNAAILVPLGLQGGFIAKYDSAGNYIWARDVMTSMLNINAYGLAVDNQGNAFVTGSYHSTAYVETGSGIDSFTVPGSHPNAYIIKFDSAGAFDWINTMTSIKLVSGNACVVDLAGNVFVTGIFTGTANFNPDGTGGDTLVSVNSFPGNESNLFMAKYDAAGNYSWAKGVGGTHYAQGLDLALDAHSTTGPALYVTGFFVGTADFDPGPNVEDLVGTTFRNVFLAKYDTSGGYLWAKGMYPTAASNNDGVAVAVDTYSNVVITGNIMGSLDFDPGPDTAMVTTVGLMNMYVAKYDEGGNYLWAKNVQGTGSLSRSYDLDVDLIGNIYVTGGIGFGAADFDPGPDSAMVTAGGVADIFVAKYASCGQYTSVVQMEGSTNSPAAVGNSIVLNDFGDVYIAGQFGGNTDFDPTSGTTIMTAPVLNMCLTKLHYVNDSIPTALLTENICRDSFVLNDVVYTESGVYTQLLAGSVQCDSLVILDLTLSEIETPVINVDGFVLGVAQSYDNYQWLKDGVPVSGATDSSLLVTENGDYQVIVSNAEGCTDTSAVYTVDNVGLEAPNAWNIPVSIWPNPTRDELNIKSSVPLEATLYTIEGRMILKKKKATSLSLNGLAEGIYILHCHDETGRLLHYEKVVKRP